MNVCVLGLGAMGQRVAANFSAAGHTVSAWSRNSDLRRELLSGCEFRVCDSIAEAVAEASVVVSLLTDDEASEAVWLHPQTGALYGMSNKSIGIEMSTISQSHATRLAEKFANHGRQFVEAPVIGSRPQADTRSLVVLASGEREIVEQVTALLNSTASAVHFLGRVGTSATVKLAVNGLFAAQVATFAEIYRLLETLLPDPSIALGVIRDSPITSPAMQRMLTLFLQNLFDPNFPIALVAKDLRYLQQLGELVARALPISRVVGDQFEAACNSNLSELDISAIYKLPL
jgi:3-hydroxyisobutyrate dehydrogenase